MTNGVCGQYCDTDAKPGLPPRVFGVNYVGGTIKLSIVDADRSKRAVQGTHTNGGNIMCIEHMICFMCDDVYL